MQGDILLGQNSYYDLYTLIAEQSQFLCIYNNVSRALQTALQSTFSCMAPFDPPDKTVR